MSDKGILVRGFYIHSESWYASGSTQRDGVTESIQIGLYEIPDNGTEGEFSIEWSDISGRSVPRLEVYGDAFKAFGEFADVFEQLKAINKHNHYSSPKEVIEILLGCGLTDLTKRQDFNQSLPICRLCHQKMPLMPDRVAVLEEIANEYIQHLYECGEDGVVDRCQNLAFAEEKLQARGIMSCVSEQLNSGPLGDFSIGAFRKVDRTHSASSQKAYKTVGATQ